MDQKAAISAQRENPGIVKRFLNHFKLFSGRLRREDITVGPKIVQTEFRSSGRIRLKSDL